MRGTKSPLVSYVKSMISKDIVKDIVAKHICETAIFPVDVRVDSANRISVEIDSPQGVTVDDCVNISRAIEANFDREIEDFDLEVSSPGLTQPFKVLEQYLKNRGQQVSVLKRDGIKINGMLQNADNEGIELEVSTKVKGTKETLKQTVALKFSDIKATKIALTF